MTRRLPLIVGQGKGMKPSARKCVNLLLTVAMLSGTANPLVIRHSHADGERSHSHAVVHREHAHRHHHTGHRGHIHHGHSHRGHSHRADHVHPRVAGSEREQFQPSADHLHLSWFGIEVTWPQPMGNSGNDEPADESAEFVRLNSSEAMMRSEPLHFAQTVSVPAHTLGSQSSFATTDAIFDPIDDSARILLCDTARRERSGVLLT